VSAGTPLDFYRQGSRGAYAAAAAGVDTWQCISVLCPKCGARYLASVERRGKDDDAATVRFYPDIAGQILIARRSLGAECPDHGHRLRVRAFSIVG
jgi:hypothetical protein